MKFASALAALMLLCVRSATADTFGSGANSFDIEFVAIGNPGNLADTDDGDISLAGIQNFGSVSYSYRIGKYEVSEQMIDKANAQGGLGILKSSFGPNKPATGISWKVAVRFINRLNTSVGSVPAYKFAFQPGEVGYSVNADIELWAPGDVGYDADNLFRNSKARYFLPSFDEWYKAAYYDPIGVYHDFATGSDLNPISISSGTTPNSAVYGNSLRLGPADVMLDGGLSPYGTMAQGGNVAEWEESEGDLVNNSSLSPRGIRGGAWNDIVLSLDASVRINSALPFTSYANVGFRVASRLVPEPSTLLLALFCLTPALCRRKNY